uniref:Uncharacterized protein n=1 Tax=viral metagenome TaxID=1070528 RepID=A0A2V0RM03_9ZZZZ
MLGQHLNVSGVTQTLTEKAPPGLVNVQARQIEVKQDVTRGVLRLLHNLSSRLIFARNVRAMLSTQSSKSKRMKAILEQIRSYPSSNNAANLQTYVRDITGLEDPGAYLVEQSKNYHVSKVETAEAYEVKKECLRETNNGSIETLSFTGEHSMVPVLVRLNDDLKTYTTLDTPMSDYTDKREIFVKFADVGSGMEGGIIINGNVTMNKQVDGYDFTTLTNVRGVTPKVQMNLLATVKKEHITMKEHITERITEFGLSEVFIRNQLIEKLGDEAREWQFEDVCTLTSRDKTFINFTCNQVVLSYDQEVPGNTYGSVTKNKAIRLILKFSGIIIGNRSKITRVTVDEDLKSYVESEKKAGNIFIITSIVERTGTNDGQPFPSGFPKRRGQDGEDSITRQSMSVHGGENEESDLAMTEMLNEMIEKTDNRHLRIDERDRTLIAMLVDQGVDRSKLPSTHIDLYSYYKPEGMSGVNDQKTLNINSGYLVSFKHLEAFKSSHGYSRDVSEFLDELTYAFLQQFRLTNDELDDAINDLFFNTCSVGEHEHMSVCVDSEAAKLFTAKPGVSHVTPLECLQRILLSAILYVETQSSSSEVIGPTLMLTSMTYTRVMATMLSTSQILHTYNEEVDDFVQENRSVVVAHTPSPSYWALFKNTNIGSIAGYDRARSEMKQGKGEIRLLKGGLISEPRAYASVSTGLVPVAQNLKSMYVKLRIGTVSYSCDFLISDLVRAITEALNNDPDEANAPRTFIYSCAVIALLICMPDDITDYDKKPQVFVIPSPRPTRYVKPLKNISDSYLMNDDKTVKAYQQIFRKYNYYTSNVVASKSALKLKDF